jgi:hypothetical protein
MRRRYRSLTALGVLAFILVTFLAAAAPALASYYATWRWDPARPNKGAKWYTYVHDGYAADWPGWGHINETTWVVTDAGDPGENWVELGYTRGFHGDPGLTWYWARVRPGKPYQDWSIGTAISAGQWYWCRIQYITNDTWGVYINDVLKAECSPATPNDNVNCRRIDTGMEFTGTTSSMGSSFADSATNKELSYWRATEGTWNKGLNYDPGYTAHSSLIYTQYGAQAQWNSPNNWSNLHSWKVVP